MLSQASFNGNGYSDLTDVSSGSSPSGLKEGTFLMHQQLPLCLLVSKAHSQLVLGRMHVLGG